MKIVKPVLETAEKGRAARFTKGGKPGPGRPKGSQDKTTKIFKRLLIEDAEEVVKSIIQAAKEKDPTAMRICAERLMPTIAEQARMASRSAISAEELEAFTAALFTAFREAQLRKEQLIVVRDYLTKALPAGQPWVVEGEAEDV